MTKRAPTGSKRKKTQRFDTLKKRHRKQAQLFEAIERRERGQNSRLRATRARLRSSGLASPTIQRRRDEYLEIPKTVSSRPISRSLLGAVALAFFLPLFLALASSFVPHAGPSILATKTNRAVTKSTASSHAVALRGLQAPAHSRPSIEHTSTSVSHAVVQSQVTIQPRAIEQPKRIATPVRSAIVAQTQPQNNRKPSVTSRFIASMLQAVLGTSSSPANSAAPKREIAMAPKLPALVAPMQSSSPWTLSPDGTWVAVVHAPAAMRGADFQASTGQLIELERSAISPDAAIVTIGWSRSVTVTISASDQTLTKTLPAPDASTEAFDAAARAIGPGMVNVGWTPLEDAASVSDYEVFRSSGEGERPALIATLPAAKHSYHDVDVDPASRYRYTVVAETTDASIQASTPTVDTPPALSTAPARVVSGKGMFLYFSSLPGDPRNFHRYDPGLAIAEAQRAGIRVIELRMARGTCTMAQTEAAQVWLDRLIDAAASANIKLLAWTVPRRTTSLDLAETIAAASYTTPSGNGFAGLALDLESGDNYMGDGPKAREAMVEYIKDVRAATGVHYLIVATVASPHMGHTNDDYPYAKIAAYADVLQPMEYWHYFEEAVHHEYARGEVAGAAADAVARTRELAGRNIPVDVAGQSVDLQGTGAPSGREILWSLGGAKSVGAIGETFFDWAGTQPDAWAAIQAFDW